MASKILEKKKKTTRKWKGFPIHLSVKTRDVNNKKTKGDSKISLGRPEI